MNKINILMGQFFLIMLLTNCTVESQTIQNFQNACNCKQMFFYRDEFKIDVNGIVLNEYYNDSILIVKYGRYNVAYPFSFNNFIEFVNRRDTFYISNGDYYKILNNYKYPVFSNRMFQTGVKSYNFNFIEDLLWINKITYLPKAIHKGLNDSVYYIYEIKSSHLTPSSNLSFDYKKLVNHNETDSMMSGAFIKYEPLNELGYFYPGIGFVKVISGNGLTSKWIYKSLETENCYSFLSRKFKYWTPN